MLAASAIDAKIPYAPHLLFPDCKFLASEVFGEVGFAPPDPKFYAGPSGISWKRRFERLGTAKTPIMGAVNRYSHSGTSRTHTGQYAIWGESHCSKAGLSFKALTASSREVIKVS